MNNIRDHIENTPDLGVTGKYCAIIGETPSQGARSPKLWNAVFDAKGMDTCFHPFDVTGEKLSDVMSVLRSDSNFMGGSVAMPYKSTIMSMLDHIEPLAQTIGAVNAMYRDGGKLVGTNTDGAGAIHSILEKLGTDDLGPSRVVQVGLGGAGMAVAAYLADSLSSDGKLLLCNRNYAKATEFAAHLGDHVQAISFPPSALDMEGADIVVNCTSLGFSTGVDDRKVQLEKAFTPFGPVSGIVENISESVIAIESASPDALIFDIVYQPATTPLITLASALGRQTLGGIGMNLEQAVIAFEKAVSCDLTRSKIRTIMADVT